MSSIWTRRQLLQVACAGGLAMAGGVAVGETPAAERALELFNTHTGETVRVVYRRGAQYLAPALDQLHHVLRDHRNGAAHPIDVQLFDQMHELAVAAQREPRYQIISGYRSPESNAKMAARPGSGVAKGSLHVQGRAIDVRLRGCSCSQLRDLALAAERGGVGYYHRSDFVHLDTGRFRAWNG